MSRKCHCVSDKVTQIIEATEDALHYGGLFLVFGP